MIDAQRWRSFLFVPGNRPDRFAKALAAGADAVCVDLEDAVAPEEKDGARSAALEFLRETSPGPARVVRINSVRTRQGLKDLLALCEAAPRSGAVAVPKVESAEEVRWVAGLLADANVGLVTQVETIGALKNVDAIASASPETVAIMFGGLDLAAEIGVPPSWEALLQARSAVALAAAGNGLGAIDMPLPEARNAERCGEEARRVRAMGFTAKMAIHPAQVEAINEAFSPSAEEIAEAERVVEAFERSGRNVALLDGKMIERPVIENMRRVLSRAPVSSA